MSLRYKITGTRKTAVLYYQKEYGTRLCNKLLKRMQKLQNGLFEIETARTKQFAEHLANKIQFITAYQQGRLNQRLGDGHALTVSIIWI